MTDEEDTQILIIIGLVIIGAFIGYFFMEKSIGGVIVGMIAFPICSALSILLVLAILILLFVILNTFSKVVFKIGVDL